MSLWPALLLLGVTLACATVGALMAAALGRAWRLAARCARGNSTTWLLSASASLLGLYAALKLAAGWLPWEEFALLSLIVLALLAPRVRRRAEENAARLTGVPGQRAASLLRARGSMAALATPALCLVLLSPALVLLWDRVLHGG